MKNIPILIIDDSESDRYILKRQLTETGLTFNVFEEENGKEALEFFSNYEEKRAKNPDKFPPLAIFLDINMPLVSGFEFLEKFGPIRDQHNIQTSFIMMFSSSESEADKEKAFSYSYVKSYLTKGRYSTGQLTQLFDELCA